MSEDERYFVLNPDFVDALTPAARGNLRKKAFDRMAGAFWGG